MAEDLQALLDRINEDGLKKAEAGRQEILRKAREEAGRILKDAEDRAAGVVAQARREADMLARKADQALRQAARDMLLALRGELEKRVAGAVRDLLRDDLADADWGSLLAAVCTSYLRQEGRQEDLEVLVPAKDLAAIRAAVAKALAEDLRKRCELAPSPSLRKGFRVLIKGTDVMYDFSDEALVEAIAGFVGPGIAAVITAREEQ